MDASFRDWAGLPVHIIDIIVIKQDKLSDYVHFCGVCSLWRHVALEVGVNHKINLNILKASRKKLPMLMFRTDENNDVERGIYSISDETTVDFKLPLPYKYRFVGSSRGWLFCLEKTMVITLVNPLIGACIRLPVFKDPCHVFKHEWLKRYFPFYITKGILLSDPHECPDSFGVVVIYGDLGKLAFLKYGEPSWTLINSKDSIHDIIWYKGILYGVDCWGKFFEIDIASRTIKTIVPKSNHGANCVYLIESQDGELLMVKRVWIQHLPNFNQGEEEHLEREDFENEDYDDDNLDGRSENSDGYGSETSDGDRSYDSQESCDLGDEDFPRSFEFKVFKMTQPIKAASASWVEIDNLGQQILCVGDNSVSVSTVEFPGCLPNSIYYTSQHHCWIFPYSYRWGNEDSGIFNLQDKEFYLHHVLDSSRKYKQPPIWFVPNPREMHLD